MPDLLGHFSSGCIYCTDQRSIHESRHWHSEPLKREAPGKHSCFRPQVANPNRDNCLDLINPSSRGLSFTNQIKIIQIPMTLGDYLNYLKTMLLQASNYFYNQLKSYIVLNVCFKTILCCSVQNKVKWEKWSKPTENRNKSIEDSSTVLLILKKKTLNFLLTEIIILRISAENENQPNKSISVLKNHSLPE